MRKKSGFSFDERYEERRIDPMAARRGLRLEPDIVLAEQCAGRAMPGVLPQRVALVAKRPRIEWKNRFEMRRILLRDVELLGAEA